MSDERPQEPRAKVRIRPDPTRAPGQGKRPQEPAAPAPQQAESTPDPKEPTLDERIAQAKDLGVYMVCIWTVEKGQIKLWRILKNYPNGDIQKSIDLFVKGTKDLPRE